jgi:N-acetylglucosamine-6-phosphate deacetylase
VPSRLLITNGVLALPGGPRRADILCDGHRVVALGRDLEAHGAATFNAHGLTLGPGFVDVHVHGGGGHSFFGSDPAAVEAYSAWAPRNGVTGFLVSTVGRNAPETERVLEGLRPAIGIATGAEPLGFHLEGPFINPLRKGAFHPDMLHQPDRHEFLRYQEAAGGLIRQVTIAPELPLAIDVIAAATVSGALPAMGHTDATVEQARAGFEAGVRHVTHLYNAMRPLHQREGGPSVAALLEDSVTCELICDGAHVAPDVLRMAYRILGPNRTVVVTDNLHIAGTGSGTGRFGGEDVEVSGGKAARADGTIVGSVLTMDQHFRNVQEFLDVDVATAFRLCATNPARIAMAAGRKGSLSRGFDADVVMLDSGCNVVATLCRGEVAYLADPGRGPAVPGDPQTRLWTKRKV